MPILQIYGNNEYRYHIYSLWCSAYDIMPVVSLGPARILFQEGIRYTLVLLRRNSCKEEECRIAGKDVRLWKHSVMGVTWKWGYLIIIVMLNSWLEVTYAKPDSGVNVMMVLGGLGLRVED